MRYVADLHIHSHLSRATSRDLNLEQLHRWAQLKGVTVVATGDFTHPRWFAELRDKLVPAEPGLFALAPELAQAVDAEVPEACRAPVRFLLSVETSGIYKRGGRVRKVHNLIYSPDLESAARVAARLARIGNIESDGRPILGLDSRDLLEMTLESSPDCFLVPAHVWTPWFSALGAQSGFDSIEECFGDLAKHVFALETGLSSDPAMNWRLSSLDRYALISNSDAHSPDKLGREANRFDCELSYYALRDALRGVRDGFVGTIEFFPEEGKYHFDGHRKCGVVVAPDEARATGGICPRCGERLTAGVMGRVAGLADRPEGARPGVARPFQSLVPLAEVIGEVMETGPRSGRVRQAYQRLLSRLGPELVVLAESPLDDLRREGPPLLAEAVERIRNGRVRMSAGFDGEYGVVRAFDDSERRKLLAQVSFAFGESGVAKARRRSRPAPRPAGVGDEQPALLRPTVELDPEQERVVRHGFGPLLVVAGPGTGKTRTIVRRIAQLVRSERASPHSVTAITFTRKAAAELRERLEAELHSESASVTSATFHSFGLELLRAHPERAGLPADFAILDEAARLQSVERAREEAAPKVRSSTKLAEQISWAKAHAISPELAEPELAPVYGAYQRALESSGALDFDDLILRAVRLLDSSSEALAEARARCRWLFIDEYQDINAAQYQLVRLLAPEGANLCAVGDPDQAIYGFRGSNPKYFERFQQDYPGGLVVTLSRNYRSVAPVVRAASAVIDRSPGRPVRTLEPVAAGRTAVERVVVDDELGEASFIAAEIDQALGGTTMEGMRGQAPGAMALHDVAILLRTSAQMEPIAEALSRANLPFHRVGDDPLTARPRVAELLERLRSLLKPPASASSGAELAGEVGRCSVSELLKHLGEQRSDDGPWRTAVELCSALAVPYGRDVESFLSALPLLHEIDLGLEVQKVALLTLHAAKGLEFPLVFVAGCEDGLLPYQRFERPGDPEEERRLLYVGMTRAKERLVLTSARRRTFLGRTEETRPCPFLEGLPPGLLNERKVRSRHRRGRQLSLWS